MNTKLKALIPAVVTTAILSGSAMAQEATSPVQSAVSGLNGPITSIIAAALVIGMIVVAAKLGYTVAKKFLS